MRCRLLLRVPRHSSHDESNVVGSNRFRVESVNGCSPACSPIYAFRSAPSMPISRYNIFPPMKQLSLPQLSCRLRFSIGYCHIEALALRRVRLSFEYQLFESVVHCHCAVLHARPNFPRPTLNGLNLAGNISTVLLSNDVSFRFPSSIRQ